MVGRVTAISCCGQRREEGTPGASLRCNKLIHTSPICSSPATYRPSGPRPCVVSLPAWCLVGSESLPGSPGRQCAVHFKLSQTVGQRCTSLAANPHNTQSSEFFLPRSVSSAVCSLCCIVGGILADDMGLGKTLEVRAAASQQGAGEAWQAWQPEHAYTAAIPALL
jgi:hypothetical protein